MKRRSKLFFITVYTIFFVVLNCEIIAADNNTIYEAYLNILQNTDYPNYILYDMNNDGVQELMLLDSSIVMSEVCVYGYRDGKALYYGEFYQQYGMYKYDGNGLINCTGGTGVTIYTIIYEEDGYLLEKEVPYLSCSVEPTLDVEEYYFNGELINAQQFSNYEQLLLEMDLYADIHNTCDLDFINILINEDIDNIQIDYSKSIIQQVEKYTSSFDKEEISKCIENGEYQEAKKLIEKAKGEYQEICNYTGLTTNDMYIAYQFKEYMTGDFFSKGWWAKITSWLSGLFYNDELKEYLSLQSPGVNKYKDMLKQFISNTQEELVCLEYSQNLVSAMESVDELVDYFGVDTYDILHNMFSDAGSKEEIDRAVLDFVDSNPDFFKNESMVYLFRNDLSKSFTFFGAGIEYIETTVSAIMDIQYICANKNVLDYYEDFLKNIQNTKDNNGNYIAPEDLRVAAKEIEQELEGDISRIIENAIEKYGFTTASTGTEVVGLIGDGFLSEILLGMEISSLIGNMVFDMSGLVEGVAYVQGYAYLGEIYSVILEKDKKEFLNSKFETCAWQFRRDYNFLWEIRLNGEQSYLDMCDFSGVWDNGNKKLLKKWTDYEEKEDFCNDNIDMIKKFKFN